MSYKCPKCNHTKRFTVYEVVETHEWIEIEGDGLCWDSSGGTMALEDRRAMHCDECMHEGIVKDFKK